MKKVVLYLFAISFFYNISVAQELNVVGAPCTGSLYDEVQYVNTTVTLKVLLVEFLDIKHQNPTQNPGKPEYTFTNFNNMLFSSGIYVSPSMYSPDNKQVFGSLRDYYNKMSNGTFEITGSILMEMLIATAFQIG